VDDFEQMFPTADAYDADFLLKRGCRYDFHDDPHRPWYTSYFNEADAAAWAVARTTYLEMLQQEHDEGFPDAAYFTRPPRRPGADDVPANERRAPIGRG
jgi:hypothetical protein